MQHTKCLEYCTDTQLQDAVPTLQKLLLRTDHVPTLAFHNKQYFCRSSPSSHPQARNQRPSAKTSATQSSSIVTVLKLATKMATKLPGLSTNHGPVNQRLSEPVLTEVGSWTASTAKTKNNWRTSLMHNCWSNPSTIQLLHSFKIFFLWQLLKSAFSWTNYLLVVVSLWSR